ncbi:MAG TPA: Hpt domain-containing protein [Flavisolibacter sp.]|jgi:HPt (histidine-containing phosphotransfer) domain-containing protein|nr:Hpt domain-containing protein [Flavisolibacter sp.]
MTKSIFADCPELDIAFLDETYADDAETASFLFQQFLDELPTNIELLHKSLRNHDISEFRKHLHKQKPAYSYVGLTYITKQIHELQSRCLVTLDLTIYLKEIEEVLKNISECASILERAIMRLEEYKRA